MNKKGLQEHANKILLYLVRYYYDEGYKKAKFNNPKTGGYFENKVASNLGYEFVDNNILPPEFKAAALLLEEQGLVRRMVRKKKGQYKGIWPTTQGILAAEKLDQEDKLSKLEVSPLSSEDQKQNVFVIHGRDDTARVAMYTFLRSIKLHPYEWSELINETGETNPYIGTILEKGFSKTHAFIVLMTPDDLARLREDFINENDDDYESYLTPQPRQNVIFEAGMAMGKYPERTILVSLGKLRQFSDIQGRHIVRLDNSILKRKALIERLKSAGCNVILDRKKWQKAGDFSKNNYQIPKLVEDKKSDLKPDLGSPRIIDVSYEEGENRIILHLENKTKYDLSNAYLQVNRIKPEPKPAWAEGRINYVKGLFGVLPPNPHRPEYLMWDIDGYLQDRTIIESNKSAGSPSIVIENTGEAGFWINPATKGSFITQTVENAGQSLIYFDKGEVNAEIQFGGTKPDGEVLSIKFEIMFDYDGINVKMKKDWLRMI